MVKKKSVNFFDKISENLMKNSRNKKRGGGVVLTTPSSKDKNKTKKKDEEEDNDKVLLIVLILFILLFFFLLFFSFFFHVSRPRITGGSDEWARKRLIKVEKDSRSRHKISHYVYCVSDVKRMNKCTWEKTKTKNTVVSKTGHYYVAFKGVDKRGKTSRRSNIEEVYIDNNNPIIEKVKLSATKSTITIKVDAKDKESGIDKYYFSLDGKNYKEGSTKYTFKKLHINRDYNLYVKVVDRVGNETIYHTKTSIQNILNKTNNNAGDKETSIDKDKENGTDKEELEKEDVLKEEWDLPIINLDKVPVEFPIGSDYILPSYYSFGNDTGVVSCVVKGVEYKNTSELGFGNHLITCTATSSHNKSVQVQKLVKVKPEEDEDELWDGWIKLNLYYPENSTNWQWRLGREDEIRDGYEDSGWQDYTGPILVKITDIENVYIRYDLNGETVIIPPTGKIVVDIEPESYSLQGDAETTVKITYDENATVKEYRVGNDPWREYTEPFTVSKNTLIEARASKKEDVYNNKGDKLYSITVTGTDNVFIGELIPSTGGDDGTGDGTGDGSESGSGGGAGGGSGSGGGGTASGGSDGSFPYEPVENPDGEIVTKPLPGTKPSTYLDGPDISVIPDTLAENVQVSITTKEDARDIYYKIDNGKYQKYTSKFTVDKNCVVSSYYIRKRDGKISKTSIRYIQNIKVPNLPYVKLDAEPDYLTQSTNEVKVTVSGSDYDTLEYSYDGITYNTYIEPLTITNSTKIYAKGINEYGETVESLNITTKNPPLKKDELLVKITATPEKTDELIGKTTVTIDYDPKAEKKYYQLDSGEVKEYIEPFELTKNTSIRAYATKENGYGETYKVIDFLTEDIASPIIEISPSKNIPSTQVMVTVTYDRNATTKQYKVGDGNYYEYNGPFYVDMNTTIYAYNKNSLGQEKTSTLTLENIISEPPYIILDKGMYFIIKLNYPTQAKNREYKWKVDGEWKPYHHDGIMLIKPEYKDKVLSDEGIKIKIEDDNGNLIDFNGDYYLIDVPLQELTEHLFMRWDTVRPKAPTIIVNPPEYTKSTLAVIMYQDILTKKLYKTVTKDGIDSGWLEYDGGIEITDNNTVIYAKGYTRNEVESEIASFKVENIDLEKPTVKAIGDFTTKKQKVSFQVVAEDNSNKISSVIWVEGKKDASYFKDEKSSIFKARRKNNKNVIYNQSLVTVEENGYYTLYAEDEAGNSVIEVIEVTNVDKDAPNIFINVLTKEYSGIAKVEIDYGDSKVKEYRIGKNSATYKTYTDILEIRGIDFLNQTNEDGSLSIFARGTDEAGNNLEVEEKIYTLDFDAPDTPIIVAGTGYPILTEYGVKLGEDSYITFDKRDDINNFYSVDKGKTWQKYNGPFLITSGEIWAKSVKKDSGLEVISKKTVNMPTNALRPEAYDGDINTGDNTTVYKYVVVSEEMWGRKFTIRTTQKRYDSIIYFYNKNNVQIGTFSPADADKVVVSTISIPNDTYKICVSGTTSYFTTVYEIAPYITPVISNTKYYPTLTEYGVKQGYNEVTIKYFQTNVERLYSLDNGVTWKDYKDKKIRLELGQIIKVKGIDKNGNETPTVLYTSVLPADALRPEAYDGDINTGDNTTVYKYVVVSEEMWGRKFTIRTTQKRYDSIIYFYNKNNVQIGTFSPADADKVAVSTISIPNDTYKICVSGTTSYFTTVYEIAPYITPVISNTKYYPTLTEYGVKQGYNEVTIKYFQTNVERLYSLDNGVTWKDYKDKKIRLELGQIIKVKGIDKNGNETPTVLYTSVLPADALRPEAYDGDINTGDNTTIYKYVVVSEEMWGRKFTIRTTQKRYDSIIYFYNKNNVQIGTFSPADADKVVVSTISIPNDTYKICVSGTTSYFTTVYEIDAHTSPSIFNKGIYPNMNKTGIKDAYNEVTIKYIPSLKKKSYSIDNGTTWNEYEGALKLNAGTKVIAKGIDKDDKPTETVSYTVPTMTDVLDSRTFDNSLETSGIILANKNQVFTLGDDVVGQRLRIFTTNAVDASYLTIYDKAGAQVDKINLTDQITTFKIKDNYYKVVVTAGASALNISEINLRPEQTAIKNNPLIEVSDVIWNTSKGITITYPSGNYANEYSLDNGLTWNKYMDSFPTTENTTIMARSTSNGKLLGSSSFKVTKIDNVDPTIELDIPNTIAIGTDYKLPTNYTVGQSGGTPICKVGDTEYTSTKNLEVGTHTIDCSITNGIGIKKNVSASTEIIDEIKEDYGVTGSEEIFNVPASGYYRLETWGAQGGSIDTTYHGGYGGYSSGEIYLNKGTRLYVVVGGTGSKTGTAVMSTAVGGYNGGGNGLNSSTYSGLSSASGGGATHISLKSGLLSTLEEYKDQVLIVSGGGGGAWYSNSSYRIDAIGNAGGYIGSTGTGTVYGGKAGGGTQTSANSVGHVKGGFGYGANYVANIANGQLPGGGGGWYGGNSSTYCSGGGSSYIGNTLLTNKVMYCYQCQESSAEATKTISTTNVSEQPIPNYAKKGNGYAKITYIGA